MSRLRLASVLSMALAGCYAAHAPAPAEEAQHDAGPDAPGTVAQDAGHDAGPPPADAGAPPTCDDGSPLPARSTVGVDLLLVVDSSDSMIDEQVRLNAYLPAMVRALVSGDTDTDGRLDFPAVADLHVGVVTPDLGVGVPTHFCEDPDGDDGLLRTTSAAPRGCEEPYPRFLAYAPGVPGSEAELVHRVGCLAQVGTDGCRVEQPFEAALKALTPSTHDRRFLFGSPTGHGDGANAGFLRDDAVLAIVLVTDEDDCSFRDPDLWNPDSTRYEGDLRCSDYEEEALHGIERFVGGVRALKPDPDRLVVAAITGVPSDLVWSDGPVDYFSILRDPRMEKRADSRYPDQLVPACSFPESATAEPAVRIVRALWQLGDAAVLQSICSSTLDSELLAVASRVGVSLRRVECR